jgi:hypothetical protein
MEADRSEKARSRKSDMHAAGESDRPIVPKKPTNNGGVPPPAETVGNESTGTGRISEASMWDERNNEEFRLIDDARVQGFDR